MRDTLVSQAALDRLKIRSPFLTGLCRRGVVTALKSLRNGRILLQAEGNLEFGDPAAIPELTARITVRDASFFPSVAFGGTIGAAQSYMRGEWVCDDLVALVRVLVRNRSVLDGLETGWARLMVPLRTILHRLNRNTPGGSRRNIEAHYDLGNDFYETFLDPTMMYSCAFFESPESSLEDASIAKIDRLCRKLELSPGDHLLEIGTGWGGLAVHAAQHYGCRVTTTTISRRQFEFARRRFAEAGLSDRVRLLLSDYRDLSGRFNKLVSIEMIEAVGHQFYETFFRKCSELLAPDGLMALQAITIADQVYERARKEVDFIKHYIFPGSCIPSVTAISNALARATDLRLLQLEDVTPHYVRTLREWRTRFFKNLDRVRELGFSDPFIRMWEFYFCYCEGGFAERAIGDVQLVMAKPLFRGRVELVSDVREIEPAGVG